MKRSKNEEQLFNIFYVLTCLFANTYSLIFKTLTSKNLALVTIKTSDIMMRKIIDTEPKLGKVKISKIKIDFRSRDDIPKLLIGLQHIYCTSELREEIFTILKDSIGCSLNGRPGMELWQILVMGTLRLNLNIDYDRVRELVNHYDSIREMLGLSFLDSDIIFPLQTIKDNVRLSCTDL